MIKPRNKVKRSFRITDIPLKKIDAEQYFYITVQRLIVLIGNEETTDDQLNLLGKELFNKKWLGVHPQDKVILDKNGYQIINVDTYGNPGSHWVAIVTTPTHVYVYDSYGRDTKSLLPILTFMAKDRKIIIKDSRHDAEQKMNSSICGHVSLAWLETVNKYGINEALKI